jgi:hypothetical protein
MYHPTHLIRQAGQRFGSPLCNWHISKQIVHEDLRPFSIDIVVILWFQESNFEGDIYTFTMPQLMEYSKVSAFQYSAELLCHSPDK